MGKLPKALLRGNDLSFPRKLPPPMALGWRSKECLISAIFDIIDYGMLPDCLKGLRIGGTILWWSHSYFKDWNQREAPGGSYSAPWQLKCYPTKEGVLQTSILFSMLFMHPYEAIRNCHPGSCKDDVTSMCMTPSSISPFELEEAVQMLGQNLEAVMVQ